MGSFDDDSSFHQLLDERGGFAGDASGFGSGKDALQLFDDLAHCSNTVAALENMWARSGEAQDAFRDEQNPSPLLIVGQPATAGEPRNALRIHSPSVWNAPGGGHPGST